MDVIGMLTGCIAILFSLFGYFRHDKKIKEQEIKLNEIALKNESLKAEERLHAKIKADVEMKQGIIILIVRNSGLAIAKDVNFSLSPELPIISDILPIEFMNPGDRVRVVAINALGGPNKAQATFTWKDEAGEQTYHQILVFA